MLARHESGLLTSARFLGLEVTAWLVAGWCADKYASTGSRLLFAWLLFLAPSWMATVWLWPPTGRLKLFAAGCCLSLAIVAFRAVRHPDVISDEPVTTAYQVDIFLRILGLGGLAIVAWIAATVWVARRSRPQVP